MLQMPAVSAEWLPGSAHLPRTGMRTAWIHEKFTGSPKPLRVIQSTFHEAAEALVETGRWLHARGWLPATSGNLSLRTADGIAMSASGRDKGALTCEDILKVDLDGRPLAGGKPSAETRLHCQLYRRMPLVGAVLHTHSVAATVLSRRAGAGGRIALLGYELAKALPGIRDHQTPVYLPVLGNSQDMAVLSAEADAALDAEPGLHGYLIAGHGTYTWAADLATARQQIEALEFLLTCQLHG